MNYRAGARSFPHSTQVACRGVINPQKGHIRGAGKRLAEDENEENRFDNLAAAEAILLRKLSRN